MTKTFSLTEKQAELRDAAASKARHILAYGGSRSGKTFGFCYCIAVRALMAPESRHLIARHHNIDVRQSVLMDTWPAVMRAAFPGCPMKLDKSDQFITFPNGAEVWFGGLDDKERVEKILGKEYATIYVNEASQVAYETILTLRTRLAQGATKSNGKDLALKAYYDLNPVGRDHWTYREFVEGVRPDNRKLRLPEGSRAWVQLNPTDNPNLPAAYLEELMSLPERQRQRFLDGQYLSEVPGALWPLDRIEACRVEAAPPMRRIVVAVDPSGADGSSDKADSTGIIIAGKGIDGRGYILSDRTSGEGPGGWAKTAVQAYHDFKADRLVAETNFGAAMVEHTIRTEDPQIAFKAVHASRGKKVRAEPIAALYEQGRVSHVGYYQDLEDQMVAFTTEGYQGSGSPDRADALVWALTELAFGGETIFDVPFDRIAVDPFAIPAHWPKAYAVERKDGEIAALWGAIDPTDGVIHFYAEHTVPQATMTLQAAAIRARGEWIPGMFPKQAPGRSKTEGQALMRELKDGGLLLRNVPYAEEVTETVDQVNLGRVRVFNNLRGFEREYRGYQRDEKGDLSETGLLMTCFRTWIGAGRSVAKVRDDDIAQSAAVTAGGIY